MTDCYLLDVLIRKLLETIGNTIELKDSVKNLNFHIAISLEKCLSEALEIKQIDKKINLLEIESILDFIDDEINIGHWNEIPLELRRTYTVASFVKMLLHLKFCRGNILLHDLRESLKIIDRGLLMGAPLESNQELLTKSATILSRFISEHFATSTYNILNESSGDMEIGNNQLKFVFDSIKALEIDSLVLPSLEHFNNVYFTKQNPVKLQGCIDYWPARTKWKNVDYLLETAGDRTVPVEIGTQYVDENWSQKLMTVREFVQKYYSNKEESIGYLAQHNLFDQITELRDDIRIPEYCTLSQNYDASSDPDINCWFGPAGTVSSLHYDPKNNLLAQVYGTKQVLLFSPEDSQYLYPYEGSLLSNTSQVDPMIPNQELYPNFPKAVMFKCLLREGEMLFIPAKWWHHVIALEKSFSVSFWWQ